MHNPRKKNPIAKMLPLLLMYGMGSDMYGNGPRKRQPEIVFKKCLHCGNDHSHNNSWCSPECCKAWRDEKKSN